MAHKKSTMTDIALRVATAMKQMGIDGLPRNYELVYEAYAGNNPDLVRDFIALDKYKTQTALDELGRKYLPHQHEASVLQRSAGAISGEMSNFMDLLNQERSSLNDYGRLIGEASQVIRNAGGLGEGALGSSLEALQRATEQRVTHTAEMAEKVAAQSATMDCIQKSMAEFEAVKFVDPPTKLGNRRAFNKALARVYANPDLPTLCGVVVAEVDADRRFSAGQIEALSDYLVTFYGGLIRKAFPAGAADQIPILRRRRLQTRESAEIRPYRIPAHRPHRPEHELESERKALPDLCRGCRAHRPQAGDRRNRHA